MKITPCIPLSTLIFLLVLGCGGGDGPDPSADGAGEMATPSEQAAGEEPQLGSGDSADVEAFFQDYEELIDSYCEFAERFSTASLEEMAQLGQEMASKGMEMTEYSSRAIAMRARFSPEAEERFEELQTKAEECAEKISG